MTTTEMQAKIKEIAAEDTAFTTANGFVYPGRPDLMAQRTEITLRLDAAMDALQSAERRAALAELRPCPLTAPGCDEAFYSTEFDA